MTKRRCFQCETENPPEHSFCGKCGAALTLKDFISGLVSKELGNKVRDRNTVETEIAIRSFERAWRWMKLAFGIFASAAGLAIVVILAVGGWKAHDLLKTVDAVKQAIVESADATRNEISTKSAQSVSDIQKASKEAIAANHISSANAAQLSNDMRNTASQTKAELNNEAASVRREVANSTSELEAAKKLQPAFDSMRAQLAQTSSELDVQQKKISSSEEFVKQVFGTHVSYTFTFSSFTEGDITAPAEPVGNQDSMSSGIVVKNKEATSTVVYMLVPYHPIDGTLQMQRKNVLATPDSYLVVHNLIVLFWGDPPETLKDSPLFVSFFPDKTDKDTIKTIVLRDGRIFADGEPMPKYRQEDPDFKGNKWIPTPQKPAPLEPDPKKVTPIKPKEQSLPFNG